MQKPFLLSFIVIIAVIIVIFLIFKNGNDNISTLTVDRQIFENKVSVSGKVVPADSAELGFDQSDRVVAVYYKVGDKVKKGQVIASLDNSDTTADVMQKSAALDREKAKLKQLEIGTKPEQITLYEQKYNDSKSSLIYTIRSTYLKIEGAITGKADDVFDNGQSVNPTLSVRSSSDILKRAIENSRLEVTEDLANWKNIISNLTIQSSDVDISKARQVTNETIISVKSFLDKLGTITNDLSTYNSGLTQTQIDSARSSVNGAGQDTADAANSFQTTDAIYSSARDTLALERSGSTQEEILAQKAEVRAKEADLAMSKANLAKTMITAPFDGIITKMDLKIGEVVSPNTSKVSIMSNNGFEIESYVPEINIAKLSLDNTADITLDAYNEETKFKAKIISIDPAETLRDGVSTYKIRLVFIGEDSRVKSGMTANVSITTESHENALVIPKGVIYDKDGMRYVQVLTEKGIEERSVTIGNSSSLGTTEIITGIKEGEKVVLNPNI